jgi:hypothetical protein
VYSPKLPPTTTHCIYLVRKIIKRNGAFLIVMLKFKTHTKNTEISQREHKRTHTKKHTHFPIIPAALY